jgi:hypothetical protein
MTTATAFAATDRFNRYVDEANELFNAGFTSKAGQKRALDNLSRAFREVRDAHFNALISAAPKLTNPTDPDMGEWAARVEHFNANEVPFDLHQIRDRHFPVLDAFLPGSADAVRMLVELRNTIKGAEIVEPAKDITKVRTAKVLTHLKDLMERRKAQFLEAVDLTEVLGDEGVIIHGLSANTHYVHGHKGTNFLRTFFYLHGKLTPLNTILAGAEAKAREVRGN